MENGTGISIAELNTTSPDFGMIDNLQKNIYQFSGAKNYNQLEAMTKAMFDKDGKILPFNDFKREVAKINGQFNENWLKTEHNTAVNSSTNAARWNDYEKNADIMPYLQYDAVNDERTRESHRRLDGIVKRIDDPFWNKYYPPNDYNCRCSVIQLPGSEEEETEVTTNELPKIPEMFSANTGKEQIVFPPKHPYYKGIPKKVGKEAEKLRKKDNGSK